MDDMTHHLITQALREARTFVVRTENGIAAMANVRVRAIPEQGGTGYTFLVDLLTDALNQHNAGH